MKKAFLLVILLIPALAGCKFLDKAGDKVFDPVIETKITHTNRIVDVPEITQLPDGTTETNMVEQLQPVKLITTHTNGWVLKSGIEKTIHLAGDVVPFPWASLAANAIVATLGGIAHLRGRKWKKATVSAVQSADKWRQVVKELDPKTDQKIKADAIKEQRASGTIGLISQVVQNVLK